MNCIYLSIYPFIICPYIYPSMSVTSICPLISSFIHPTTYPSNTSSIYNIYQSIHHFIIHPSIHLFNHSSIHPSICQLHPSIHFIIHLSIYLTFTYPFIPSFIHPSNTSSINPSTISSFIYSYIHPLVNYIIHQLICSFHQCIHLSIHSSIYSNNHQSIWPFHHPSIHPSITLSTLSIIHPSLICIQFLLLFYCWLWLDSDLHKYDLKNCKYWLYVFGLKFCDRLFSTIILDILLNRFNTLSRVMVDEPSYTVNRSMFCIKQ